MDNPWGRFELRIDGDKHGDMEWADVWQSIESHVRALPDAYGDEFWFEIEDFGAPRVGVPVRIFRWKGPGGIWDACCEDPGSFAMYADLCGWEQING